MSLPGVAQVPTGRRRRQLPARPVLENVAARVVALAALSVVTVIVARSSGPAAVGNLALLRVLPGLLGVVTACGLPGAVAYFVAGPDRDHPRLWPTIVAVMLAGAVLGAGLWLLLTPLIRAVLFRDVGLTLLAFVATTVATQLPVAVGKAALQGLEDHRGCNVTIAAEEVAFLPAYLVAAFAGLHGTALLVVALLAADVVVACGAWLRVARRLRGSSHSLGWVPDRALGRRMVGYGTRSQVGGVMTLLNLRLDFIVLGALAGPVAVGVYGVASKYAELLRLPALAVTWVAYPRAARQGASALLARVRQQLRLLLVLGVLGAAVLAALSGLILPAVYGAEFDAAVAPAVLILAGLVLEPAGALGSAFLLGTGRPGLNSAVVGAGLVVTAGLDLALIPALGVMGAAAASTAAYLTTDLFLVVLLWRAGTP